MLREVTIGRRHEDGRPTRWFSDDYFDLFVWLDDDGAVQQFQLTYDKPRAEHALSWRAPGRFTHEAVDDGEGRGGKHKASPIFVADGIFDHEALHARFLAESGDIDADIADFVAGRIAAWPAGSG